MKRTCWAGIPISRRTRTRPAAGRPVRSRPAGGATAPWRVWKRAVAALAWYSAARVPPVFRRRDFGGCRNRGRQQRITESGIPFTLGGGWFRRDAGFVPGTRIPRRRRQRSDPRHGAGDRTGVSLTLVRRESAGSKTSSRAYADAPSHSGCAHNRFQSSVLSLT